jgi:hypothetical protein
MDAILPVFELRFHWFFDNLRVIRICGSVEVCLNEDNGENQPGRGRFISPN